MQQLFAHIDANHASYVQTLTKWAAINSGTLNLAGLDRMLEELRRAFAILGGAQQIVELPPRLSTDSHGKLVKTALGRGLQIIKRADAPRRVFLNIHYDTVFGVDHAFQNVRQLDADTINGPGVCDAKGGIVTMLAAMRAFEESTPPERRDPLGWEIFLNPDEELGSPGSSNFLCDAGKRHIIGLLFEPALPDGSIVGARKGSGNFTIVVNGRAAHAGRDFHAGRSATVALAEVIMRIDEAARKLGGGITVNCGKIEGGGAVNIVPDFAMGQFNARASTMDESYKVGALFESVVREIRMREGITSELYGGFSSPPKIVDAKSQALIDHVLRCAKDIGLGDLAVKSSGGASDGNKLAAAGMAVIDTLGPVGGEIHSDREYVKLSTIGQRAKVVALLLSRLADSSP